MSVFNLRDKTIEIKQNHKTDFGLIDYDFYTMTGKEKVLNILVAAIIVFLIGYVFYRNIVISIILCLLGLLYPKIKTQNIIIKRKAELNLQFKDLLYSLSSSMSAGKSVETAFRYALNDLQVLYPNRDTNINMEIEYIVRKIEMNETVESALSNFASRAHIEDIDNFVDVFKTCKRSGGNLVEVIQNTSKIINYKIEIKEEINTMISAKKLEQRVLNAMPIFMILFLSVSATDYISPIFTTVIGRLVITVAIVLLIIAYFISKRIMDIKV